MDTNDGDIWLSQDQIVELYQSSKSNISEHIKHILEEHELDENSVVRNFRITAKDNKKYNVKHYNLNMILAIGYRVRSNIGTAFRQWATETLNEYLNKGFVMNDNLLKEAGGGRYFKELLSRIRDIRSSEKVFWRQVLDIFATSVDYDSKSEVAITLFKTIQNKMHWAVSGKTAAEIIADRAKAEKVMTMADWSNELDYFLKMTRKDILNNKGLISHEKAIEHAKEEYEKFRKRFTDNPTEVERKYLENMNSLFLIEKRNK